MSLLKRISSHKFVRLLGLSAPRSDQLVLKSFELLNEEDTKVFSLERIKDLIIEAYSVGNAQQRIALLERADRQEAQLVAIYRARGLQITADNICDTLDNHRKRYFKQSS